MSALATSIVAMLTALLPVIQSVASSQIDTIINVLIALIPQAVQEITSIGPSISNVIAALRGNTAITEAQLEQLQQVEASLDAAFEAAAKAAGG